MVLAGVKLEVCQAAEISSDGQVVFSVDWQVFPFSTSRLSLLFFFW